LFFDSCWSIVIRCVELELRPLFMLP